MVSNSLAAPNDPETIPKYGLKLTFKRTLQMPLKCLICVKDDCLISLYY